MNNKIKKIRVTQINEKQYIGKQELIRNYVLNQFSVPSEGLFQDQGCLKRSCLMLITHFMCQQCDCVLLFARW